MQYAHARICSVLAAWGGDVAGAEAVDLSPLQSPAAQALMLQLAKYPDMLTRAAKDFAPHDVTFYLRELAASYHSYYDAERILVDDEPVQAGPPGAGRGHRAGAAQWPGSSRRQRAAQDVMARITMKTKTTRQHRHRA